MAIVDDHPLVRRGIAGILCDAPDLELVGEAANESEAKVLLNASRVDLLLVDWSLRGGDSSALIRCLLGSQPQLKVLVLSIHDDATHAERAVRAGAHGYIMKEEATEKVLLGVRSLLSGQTFFSDRARRSLSVAASNRVIKLGRPEESPAAPPLFNPGEPFSQWAVSVVVPVFNSGSTLRILCERLMCVLGGVKRLEIILVDDGSTDESATVCAEIHADYPRVVQFICLARNFGEHSALLTGLREVRGDYCVLMDDDLQNPPEEVPVLLRQVAFGYDVVYSQPTRRCHPWFRRVGSALHNWIANFLLQKPKGLYLSSFKVLSASVVSQICSYHGPEPYLDALIFRATSNVGTIEARHEARARGCSGYSFPKLIGLWWRLVSGFSNWPLRAAALLLMMGLWLAVDSGSGVQSAAGEGRKISGVLAIGLALWLIAEHVGLIREMQIGMPKVVIRLRSERSEHAAEEEPIHTQVKRSVAP